MHLTRAAGQRYECVSHSVTSVSELRDLCGPPELIPCAEISLHLGLIPGFVASCFTDPV